MKIIGAEHSQVLAAKTAHILGAGLLSAEFRSFPDGELYVRADAQADDLVIIGSITNSDSLIQLLLLIDACEDADDLTLVIPYMGYARQDKKFCPGEPISARAVAMALSQGIDRAYTINIHEETVLEHFEVPAENISIAERISDYIGSKAPDNPLILAPDEGAAKFAADVAAFAGCEHDHLQKTRLSGTEVNIAPKSIDTKGRTVFIVDDIISTGGTLAKAAGMLMEQGAAEVHAACVHGVFTNGGYARLAAAGIKSVAASDTIESGASSFSAAESIAAALRGK
jgi:ribose-phosphate pyrophosphokinase